MSGATTGSGGFNWQGVIQALGGILYAGGAAIAGGAIPLPPQYAWIPVAVGFIMRTFTNSNAAVPASLAPPAPPAKSPVSGVPTA